MLTRRFPTRRFYSSVAPSSSAVRSAERSVKERLDLQEHLKAQGPQPILPPSAFRPTGEPRTTKLGSWDLWGALGNPKKVVAPMVDGSDLAWRILSRRYGADLCYTPMIHSRMYTLEGVGHSPKGFRNMIFNQSAGEEGAYRIPLTMRSGQTVTGTDRPLVAQFCGDDPDLLLFAANDVADHCDAVDLNLGCPQSIAKRGHYGAFLQDEWPLIFDMINVLHLECKVPVTAKMRIFEDPERTVAYAQMLERAGAQVITVHGRTRECRGPLAGIADWLQIKLVKQNVQVPVIANGNVLFSQDMDDALQTTDADAIMSAEGQLSNPGLFATSLPTPTPGQQILDPTPIYPRLIDLAREYLELVLAVQTPTTGTAIRSHLFKILYPALAVYTEFRPRIGGVSLHANAARPEQVASFDPILDELEATLRLDEQLFNQARDQSGTFFADLTHCLPKKPARNPVEYYQRLTPDSTSRPHYVAHWLAQPYIRHPTANVEKDSVQQEKTKVMLASTSKKRIRTPQHQTTQDLEATISSFSSPSQPGAEQTFL